jgi:isoleucyl-tRNA synthetase
VLSSLEKARDKKFIGSSLEAKVILKASNEDYDLLNGVKAEALKDLFIVSGVAIERNTMADFNITEAVVEKAEGEKCARCWKYDASVGKHTDYNDVCDRCHDVLINL